MEQSAKVWLKININKTKVLKIKAENQNSIMAGEDHFEEVDQFTYLGSIVDLKGGTDADIKVGIGKVRSAYKRIKNCGTAQVSSYDVESNCLIKINYL